MDIAAPTISLIAIGIAIVIAWREFGGAQPLSDAAARESPAEAGLSALAGRGTAASR